MRNSNWEEKLLKELVSPRDRAIFVKPPAIESPQLSLVELVEILGEYWRIFMAPTSSSIHFPIRNIIGDTPMKPIPLTTMPNFMCFPLKTLIHSFSNLTLSVEGTIISPMLRS